MAKASLFKVAQRVLEFVNDPLTKASGACCISTGWTPDNRSASKTWATMDPQWRSKTSIKTTTACHAHGCARLTRSPRRCFTRAHACLESVVHSADVIDSVVATRLVRRLTCRNNVFIKLQRWPFICASSGSCVSIQFTAAKYTADRLPSPDVEGSADPRCVQDHASTGMPNKCCRTS